MKKDGIAFEIRSLSNEIKRYLDKENHPGLTGVQHGILCYIGLTSRHKDVFQKDIEIKFNIRRSTATGILQLMEKNQFLYREPIKEDGRLKKIQLTEKGQTSFLELRSHLNTLEETIVENVSPDDFAIFVKVMHQISQNITCPTEPRNK